MWRYPALLVLACLLIFGLVMLVGSFFVERATAKAMRTALETARRQRNNVWKEVDGIQEMVALYMRMVAKHGPESEEAKAFRFGTDSRLMRELHNDSGAMQAFEQQANIIDETYRQIRA